MKRNVRIIGGANAGELFQWDMQTQGPIFRVPKHPDFVFCRDCKPDEFDSTQSMVVHSEKYECHEMHYGSGHKHVYAIPAGMRIVDAMNVMWHEYAKAQETDDDE